MILSDRQVNFLKASRYRYVRMMDKLECCVDPKGEWTEIDIKELPEGRNRRDTKLNYGEIIDLEDL